MEKPKKLIILERVLRFMASAVLKKYHPIVIGITGSIGKTSTKEAVFSVIKDKFRTRKNEKNYNNEIGIPLTIIGSETGGRSFFKWVSIFFQWLFLIILPMKYPEVLILEMGADRPGDIKYLTDFVRPKIGIITDISGSHLEFFNNIEGVAEEKGILVKSLDKDGFAILNADNERVIRMKGQLEIRSLSYGFSDDADMKAEGAVYNYEDGEIKGISFKLGYKGTNLPVRLGGILAKHQIYAALAGAAAGTELGMNLLEISESLRSFSSPSGRMTLIKGIKDSFLIDDTYNASPTSVTAALDTLGEIDSGRKIAVLGDMLELGNDTQSGHEKIAEKFLSIKGDIFIGVGTRMGFAIERLLKKGFPKENMFHFRNSLEAGKYLEKIISPRDLVLIKGSQGARMEKVTEEVMRNPESAAKLLCRQDKKWKSTPIKDI